jgi:hypothetical protein
LRRELETRVGFQIVQDHSTNHSETTTYRGISVTSIAGDSGSCDDFILFQESNNKFKIDDRILPCRMKENFTCRFDESVLWFSRVWIDMIAWQLKVFSFSHLVNFNRDCSILSFSLGSQTITSFMRHSDQMEDNLILPEDEQRKAPLAQGASVLQRITKVIGACPNLGDLIPIVEQRHGTTLTRKERRSKKLVVAKFESMRDQLLAELGTSAGIQALQ